MRAGTLSLVAACGLGAAGCSTTQDSVTAGNAPAGSYSFCEALTATCNSFYGGPAAPEYYVSGVASSCVSAAAAQCSTLQSNYSEAFKNAVVGCAKTHSPCDEAFRNCVYSATAGAAPTAAQTKVKADFCATYGSVLGICDSFFQVTELGDGGPSSGTGEPPWAGQGFTFGDGFIALVVNDSFATKMDACIGTTAAEAPDGGSVDGGPASCLNCLEDLQACADAVYSAAVSPGCKPGDGG